MKRLVPFLLFIALLSCYAAWWLMRAPFGPSAEIFVDIPAGTGTAEMGARLKQAGVIRSRYAFEIYRLEQGGSPQAGVYRFDHPAPLREVYARIERGDVYTIALVIPEGFNIFDIAGAVETAGLGEAHSFLVAERSNTALIADLNPGADSLEGFLFPDTYRFSPHATPVMILAAMVKRFRQVAAPLGLLRSPDPARVVTLASLVEKEVHLDAERPLVAGVFENRLRLGMPLATDPAIIYAALLSGRWRGTIYQSDLERESLYNTYRHTGVPPGPIANPGVAALKAALHPAATDYLYFVADRNGATRFSPDLKEHARQVAAYRAGQSTR